MKYQNELWEISCFTQCSIVKSFIMWKVNDCPYLFRKKKHAMMMSKVFIQCIFQLSKLIWSFCYLKFYCKYCNRWMLLWILDYDFSLLCTGSYLLLFHDAMSVFTTRHSSLPDNELSITITTLVVFLRCLVKAWMVSPGLPRMVSWRSLVTW